MKLEDIRDISNHTFKWQNPDLFFLNFIKILLNRPKIIFNMCEVYTASQYNELHVHTMQETTNIIEDISN